MGAGSTKEHYMQDTSEIYFVWKARQNVKEKNIFKNVYGDSISETENQYISYANERGVLDDFRKCEYKKSIDLAINGVIEQLSKTYPNALFDFESVEAELRNKNMKGDFYLYIVIDDKITRTSVSLKNYKKGYDRIQVCSGTWNSFMNNFLFTPAGVGRFVDPFSGKLFQGSDVETRNSLITKMGLEFLIEAYDFVDGVQSQIKKKYTYGEKAEYWNDIQHEWVNDCQVLSLSAVNKIYDGLSQLDSSMVKSRFIKMTGLNYDEELLLIDKKGNHLFSLTEEKYKNILTRVNNPDSVVTIGIKKKSITFTAEDEDGVVVRVEVPLTLQKNGAWYLPKGEAYNGTQYHAKEKVELAYGQRRPKKSKEIATSINTYVKLREALNLQG